MNTTSLIEQLHEKCKCGVYVTINEHRDYYQSVESYFEDRLLADPDIINDIGKDTYTEMKELDTIIQVQFYPKTPNVFYVVYHYSLEQALVEAVSVLKEG